ncbi:hypothetical protein [Sphaerisporangium rhizosphaerae]|uniref:Uncharacterized protein n=1 Tax=Sphaerisporangium rhizosphaerae TaxID=2269375 RepID=A0ABW2NYT4_9ACTN
MGQVICEECKDHRHDDCRGGSWCDCQHRPADEPRESVLVWSHTS